MTPESDQKLRTLDRLWEMNGDLMICRKCRRALIASRDGEPLRHAADCESAAHPHPWTDLKLALAD